MPLPLLPGVLTEPAPRIASSGRPQSRPPVPLRTRPATTLGLVDVGYTDPDNARVGDLPDYLDYYFQGPLSRYDGLLAVRLSPLGAYALGLAATYQPGPRPRASPAGSS